MRFTRLIYAGLILSGYLLSMQQTSFASMTAQICLNTAPLAGHPAGPFSLDFQLNGAQGNTANLYGFSFGAGGGPLAGATLMGGASGNLSSAVALTETAFLNDFTQAFMPGGLLCFQLALSTQTQPRGFPDEFTFAILDSTGAELPTTMFPDVFVNIDITSQPTIQIFGSNPNQNPRGCGPALIIAPATVQVAGTEGHFTIRGSSRVHSLILNSGDAAGTVPSNSGLIAVPNVVGRTQAVAQAAIVNAGLVVGSVFTQFSATVPAGSVISQAPTACTQVTAGWPVALTVSSGSSVVVPNVAGQTQAAATAAITGLGLTVGTVTTQSSLTVPAGTVISQDPAAGTSVAPGSAVNLVISSGPQMVTVPNVVGLWQHAAQSFLVNFAFTVTRQPSTTVPDGNVISQNPAGGTIVAFGSTTVSLVISSGAKTIAVVPNFAGQGYAVAVTGIPTAGFAVGSVTTQPSQAVPADTVISQNPAGGSSVQWDTSVSLIVSSGPLVHAVIPDVVGMTQAAAVTALSNAQHCYLLETCIAGLGHAVTSQASTTVPAFTVISQDPKPGAALVAAADAPVNLIVSSGPLVSLPRYTWLSQFGVTGTQIGEINFGAIAIDPASHNIVVAGNADAQIFNSAGGYQSYFGGEQDDPNYFGLDNNGLFLNVQGVAIDPISHNIVVSDVRRVLIFNSAGMYQSQFALAGQPSGPPFYFTFANRGGIAIDPASRNIVVADSLNAVVQIFNSAGIFQSQFGGLGSGNGKLRAPGGIAIDPVSHNIVVADTGNGFVQIFNSAGIFQSQFGGPVPGNGTYWGPLAVAIDPDSHNIVVGASGTADFPDSGGIVQIFNSAGVYQGEFGGSRGSFPSLGGYGPPYQADRGNGQISIGLSVAIDPGTHNILVLDSTGRVEVFAPAGAAQSTATALTSSIDPSIVGQSVTFTATVTGSSPTGSVLFNDGSTSLGAPITLAGGTATFATAALAQGTHSITAVYSGDANNAGSTSSAVVQTVSPVTIPHSTSLSLKESPVSGAAGVPVTVIASLLDTSANPAVPLTGQSISFVLGTATCSASTVASGTASCTLTPPGPPGTLTLRANFSGNAQFLASADSLGFTVSSVAPTNIAGNITAKTGPQNARIWSIALYSSGPGPANGAQITGLTLTQTFGPTCTPVRISPSAFPLTVGDISAGGSLNGQVTFDFTGCEATARFQVDATFSANGGATAGSMVRYNQYQ